jgi:hypothetical protein
MKRLFSFALLAAPAISLAQQPSFKGTLFIEGKSRPVQHVCAVEEEDPFDDKKTVVVVVVSPAPPSPAGATCKALYREIGQRMHQDGVPGLVANIERPAMTWENGTIYAKDSSISYSYSGTDTVTKFTPKPGAVFGGRLWTNGEIKMGGDPTKVDVTFEIPIEALPPKTAAIAGAKALQHPATIAAKGFLTAMTQGDPAKIRSFIVEAERPRFDAMMKSPDRAQTLDMMKEMAKGTLTLPSASVTMRGETAEVRLERISGSSKEKSSFRMKQEQGAWRVTQDR